MSKKKQKTYNHYVPQFVELADKGLVEREVSARKGYWKIKE